MDYAKRAEWLVPIGVVNGGVIVSVRCEPVGPIETEELEYFGDEDGNAIGRAEALAASVRSVIAAELQAAHDAGVAEGKAGERALEMFVVRSLAHEVDGGDDKTAEQLIEMLLAERDDAVALARDAVRFVEEARNVRENLCMGVTMPNAWLDRAKALGKESGQ